ncbi:GntR family transcriptional regulator of abcA and norABC [Enterococcus sp. PF1-24]|uniref:aminotransferase-like domain-containing protein n=1 Tax=unclassified Enterococcus TaxID=2608891 RepID=UPI002475BE3D|nr:MULTISPECIES: PLP-dependent aminotransferase family protein [unclassified Enterococcus]MDH6364210.1 GntR family transcriptional regulator of abcA and norABC [Enterococcus sp. PFB1-1]MDH6401311.1 GntR family transcriptional regulator of abcA and norABC [Enterococcus sp. PF1-24]
MKWQLKKENKTPIYVEIMELIINKIQTGELVAGEKLPTEREMAKWFAVNRSTVVHALEELVSLGWIIRKQGSGTRVNEGNWGRLSAPRTNWKNYLSQNVFNQQNPYVTELKKMIAEENCLDLYTGELPRELIPDFQLPSYHWEDFLKEGSQLSESGYGPLQQTIIERLQKDQQLTINKKQLLITSGAQQGLFLLLQVLLTQGDSIAIENPSFLYSLPIFQAAGIRLYGVKMDTEGISLTDLKDLIVTKKIKMLILNPNYQNPTGNTMSLARRKALVELCGTYQIPIVEDDVFGDLNFQERLPLLKNLAPQQVIYLGSLSKILGSSTKIGWICAPESIIQPLAEARQVMDFSLSIFPQVLATSALGDDSYEEKLADLRDQLKVRAIQFQNAMEEFAADWQVHEIKGGFYAWLEWRHGEITNKQWRYFLEEKLAIAPSFLFSSEKNALRINFTRLSQENFPQFLATFRRITHRLKAK